MVAVMAMSRACVEKGSAKVDSHRIAHEPSNGLLGGREHRRLEQRVAGQSVGSSRGLGGSISISVIANMWARNRIEFSGTAGRI